MYIFQAAFLCPQRNEAPENRLEISNREQGSSIQGASTAGHSDTTSLSLYGEYPDQDDIEIVRGYSKDHRPDLKQMLFGLSTVRGVPLYGNVNNVNKDDHTWNLDTIAKLDGLVSEDVHGKSIYIADAAAVTRDNLAQFHETKTHLISRLPATFSLCEQLKRTAWEKESAWCDLGHMSESVDSATYKIQSFRRELYGQIDKSLTPNLGSME